MRSRPRILQTSAIVLPMRMPSVIIFQRLLDDYSSGCLVREIRNTLNMTPSWASIKLVMNKESLKKYQYSVLQYQGI